MRNCGLIFQLPPCMKKILLFDRCIWSDYDYTDMYNAKFSMIDGNCFLIHDILNRWHGIYAHGMISFLWSQFTLSLHRRDWGYGLKRYIAHHHVKLSAIFSLIVSFINFYFFFLLIVTCIIDCCVCLYFILIVKLNWSEVIALSVLLHHVFKFTIPDA